MSRAGPWLPLCHSWLNTDMVKSLEKEVRGLVPGSASYLCDYQPLISQLESYLFTTKVGHCCLLKMMGLSEVQRV